MSMQMVFQNLKKNTVCVNNKLITQGLVQKLFIVQSRKLQFNIHWRMLLLSNLK